MIEVYTDGSFKRSLNLGSFAVIVFKNNNLIYAYQEECKEVTNNQMELMAIKYACEFINQFFPEEEIIIWSDSAYCVNAINEWSHTWRQNGWINSRKEPIKNKDLIQILYNYFNINFSKMQIKHLKGHNGTIGNELADATATKNKEKFLKLIKENDIFVEDIDFYKKI